MSAEKPWEELTDFELAMEAQNGRRDRERNVLEDRQRAYRARHDDEVRKVEEKLEEERAARADQRLKGTTQLALPRATTTRGAPFNVPNPGNQDNE